MAEHGRLIDADALMADCQLAQKQADRHGREFANAFYSGGGEISTEWWCVEDLIENAPTIEPDLKWIPVSERLPENGHYYLWCSDGGSVQSDYYWNGFDNGKKYGYNIVAWQPLPEPYRGEQK